MRSAGFEVQRRRTGCFRGARIVHTFGVFFCPDCVWKSEVFVLFGLSEGRTQLLAGVEDSRGFVREVFRICRDLSIPEFLGWRERMGIEPTYPLVEGTTGLKPGLLTRRSCTPVGRD